VGEPLDRSLDVAKPIRGAFNGHDFERGQDRARTSHLLTAGHESGQERAG
jgi:hypothetical protein